MAKPNTLAAAFKKIDTAPKPLPTTPPQAKQPRTKAVKPTTKPTQPPSPSRADKRALTVYLDPIAIRELKMLAAQQGKPMQELLSEGLKDLFTKYNVRSVA